MKNNKKWLGLLLCAMLVLSCALASAETYEVSGSGYGGKLDLTVTIDNGVITDIALGENHETNVVIDRAFPVIRERILEANSPVVDSVSAATFSSFAVKTAVAEAMKQAGINYATAQVLDLLANGFMDVHIYTMNRPEIIGGILKNLSCIVK